MIQVAKAKWVQEVEGINKIMMEQKLVVTREDLLPQVSFNSPSKKCKPKTKGSVSIEEEMYTDWMSHITQIKIIIQTMKRKRLE